MATNSIDVTYNDVTDNIGEQSINDMKNNFEETKGKSHYKLIVKFVVTRNTRG